MATAGMVFVLKRGIRIEWILVENTHEKARFLKESKVLKTGDARMHSNEQTSEQRRRKSERLTPHPLVGSSKQLALELLHQSVLDASFVPIERAIRWIGLALP